MGKPVSVLLCIWIASRVGVAATPDGATPLQLFGVALLCGVGFTMSFFIGALALPAAEYGSAMRAGVLGGSLLSAIAGFTVLRLASMKRVITSELA